ncbi:MAG: glycine--tRNA ligase subunit beta [Elusimicrobia bacterium RIFCSPHIGHO2_02_FULL_57_9]|nr:MAG: glycine--tRNA ligase subunit beta [Elusimicrobia bacterium RIFCSPHIGHO2_02_FULL_57_9]
MPKDFILEIGTEPLPARFVKPALEQLLRKTEGACAENRLKHKSGKYCGTLRRLAVILEGVDEKSEALSQEVQGPSARLLKDETGAFTPQAAGFAKKYGIKPQTLETVSTPKGEFLLAKVDIPGEPAIAIFSRILPAIIASLEFPKSMEWEESRLRFGRPIRTLTALYGKRVVPFKLAGVKSGRLVQGLEVYGGKPAALTEPGRYRLVLKNLLVIVDSEERRAILTQELQKTAKQLGAQLDADADLIEETVYMTEHPVPVAGAFRKEFLELPAPLLSLVLKKQLKFFPVREGAALTNSFIGVRDGISEGQKLVREGYERVLEARLRDAAFFITRDMAARLEDKLPLLERVTYQKDLGSMAQKAERVGRISSWLCESIRQQRPVKEDVAALVSRLCYADLVTEVVKEFPELQGAMGGCYARHDGCDERVALGLEQFYYPVAARTPIAATDEGALVSLAGKIDSLAGSFAVGVAPTASADPFGLRRQALGALRILLEKQLPIDLDEAFVQALSLQPVGLDQSQKSKILRQLGEFVWARAAAFFEEMGHKSDEIRSVRLDGLKNLPRTFRRLAAVHVVRRDPDFEPLAAAFKRAANILRQAQFQQENGGGSERAKLQDSAELAFYDALTSIEGQVRENVYHDGFEAGLKSLVSIKPHLDQFFDKVMVMAEDPELRRQRLSLLARLVGLFKSVADISELQGRS